MKDFDLTVPNLDAAKFRWTKNPDPKGGHLGVAFASDFGPVGTKLFDRCYSDACDLGLEIERYRESDQSNQRNHLQ